MPKPCHGSEAEFHSHLFISALVCLRSSREIGRIQLDIKNADIDTETAEEAI